MSDRKKVAIAIAGSLILHVIIILLVSQASVLWPDSAASTPSGPKPEDTPELTLLEQPTPAPPPPTTPDRQYVRTEDDQKTDQTPKDAPFQSDKDTAAATEHEGKGTDPVPTQDGKELKGLPDLALRDENYSLDQQGTAFASLPSQPPSAPSVAVAPAPEPTVTPPPTPEPTITPPATPEPTVTPLPTPEPTATPPATPQPTVTPSPTPEPTVTPVPTPELIATPQPAVTPEPASTPRLTPQPVATPAPTPETTPTPEPTPDREELAMLRLESTPVPTPAPVPTPLSTPEPVATPPPEPPPPRPAARRQPTPVTTPPPEAAQQRRQKPVPAVPKTAYRPQQVVRRMEGNLSTHGRSSVAALGTPQGRFQKAVEDAVGSRWYYYVQARADLIDVGTVQISFSVTPDGRVMHPRVLNNTSNATLANSSLQSIIDARIPPMPPELAPLVPGDGLEFTFSFNFM